MRFVAPYGFFAALFFGTGYFLNWNLPVYDFFLNKVGQSQLALSLPVDNMCGRIYQKDEAFPQTTYYRELFKICSGGYWLTDANPFTFKELDGGYGKDNWHAYYKNVMIPDADAASFHVLPFKNGHHTRPFVYAEDSAHVFIDDPDMGPPYTRIIEGADLSTFHVLDGREDESMDFAVDKNHVYNLFGFVIPEADPTSFHLVKLGVHLDAVDSHHTFYNGKVFSTFAKKSQ